MRTRLTAFAIGLAFGLASVTPPALAQDTARPKPPRRAPLRIVVTPSAQLYRQCTDWHVIEHRVTGDTVVPRSRCWWAVR